MKLFSSFILSVLLCACASVAENPAQVERVERPAVGEIAEAAIGESMVEKYVAVGQLGFLLSNPLTGKFNTLGIKSTAKIDAQRFVLAGTNEKEKVYRGAGTYCITDILLGCTTQGSPTIRVPKDKNKPTVLVHAFSKAPLAFRPPAEDTIVITTGGQPSIKKEILFNGRVGSSAKFLYREYKDDFARPAFSQELQYDLSQGAEIGFQELRIKILDTTNTGVTYTVISHFNWPS